MKKLLLTILFLSTPVLAESVDIYEYGMEVAKQELKRETRKSCADDSYVKVIEKKIKINAEKEGIDKVEVLGATRLSNYATLYGITTSDYNAPEDAQVCSILVDYGKDTFNVISLVWNVGKYFVWKPINTEQIN